MIRKDLKRAIYRTEKAYSEYLNNKKFFQALRIYNANTEIYTLLKEFMFECEENELEIVVNYIFHLEDWFNQFNQEKNGKQLNDEFIFQRLEHSHPFPKEFKELLK